MVKCNNKDKTDSCKSFKITWSETGYVSPPTSYFKGKTVGDVAKKLATRLFKEAASDPKYANETTLKMMVRETTRGSAKTTTFFKATREKLASPIIRPIGEGRTLTVTHRVKVVRCDDKWDPKTAKAPKAEKAPKAAKAAKAPKAAEIVSA